MRRRFTRESELELTDRLSSVMSARPAGSSCAGRRFHIVGRDHKPLGACYNLSGTGGTVIINGQSVSIAHTNALPLFLARDLPQHVCATSSPAHADLFIVLPLLPWWSPPVQHLGSPHGNGGPADCYAWLHKYATSTREWARFNGADHLYVHWVGHTCPGVPMWVKTKLGWSPNWNPFGPKFDLGDAVPAVNHRCDYDTANVVTWMHANGSVASNESHCRRMHMDLLQRGNKKRYVPDGSAPMEHNTHCVIYRIAVGTNYGVSLPYIEDDSASTQLKALQLGFHDRKVLVSGAWGRRAGSQSLRDNCARAIQAAPGGVFVDLDPVTEHLRNAANASGSTVRDAIEAGSTNGLGLWNGSLASLYAASRFCVVPRGDTAASKRLMTAVLAGCVPLVCSDHYALPFSSQINWSRTVLRVPEAGCIDAIGQTLPHVSIREWARLQVHLLVAAKHFRYDQASPGRSPLIESMLHEMQLVSLSGASPKG